MTNLEAKIAGLESRYQKLLVNDKDNAGVRRKIEREIRNLKKELNVVSVQENK